MSGMPFQLTKIRQATSLDSIEYFESTESTNKSALQRIKADSTVDNVLVLTEQQKADAVETIAGMPIQVL